MELLLLLLLFVYPFVINNKSISIPIAIVAFKATKISHKAIVGAPIKSIHTIGDDPVDKNPKP